MSIKNTLTTYGIVTKSFHWLIFFLVLFMIIYGFFLVDIPKEYAGMAYNIHKLIGLSILVLMSLRGIWAWMNVKPLLPKDTPDWQRWAERAVHSLLYVTIIAMPLVGWIGSSAAGKPPHIGSLNLMLPVPQSKALSGACFDVHFILALTIIGLVTIHVSAAFYHYFIKKDDILERMLPNSSSR